MSAVSSSLGPDPRSPATIAIIPARYESTRLPGKPLAEIGGLPMIEHVYRRAASARSVQAVWVATDDARIAAAVARFGGQSRMTRRSHRSGTDRLAEVAESLDCDIVVNVQGDEPMLDPTMIDEVVAPLAADATVSMATLRHAIRDPAELDDPNVVKVVTDHRGEALYFSRSAIPYPGGGGDASGGAALVGHKHIGLYAYRRAVLLTLARLPPSPLERVESLEQLRALEHGIRIRVVDTQYESLAVDTPADLERVRRLVVTGAGT